MSPSQHTWDSDIADCSAGAAGRPQGPHAASQTCNRHARLHRRGPQRIHNKPCWGMNGHTALQQAAPVQHKHMKHGPAFHILRQASPAGQSLPPHPRPLSLPSLAPAQKLPYVLRRHPPCCGLSAQGEVGQGQPRQRTPTARPASCSRHFQHTVWQMRHSMEFEVAGSDPCALTLQQHTIERTPVRTAAGVLRHVRGWPGKECWRPPQLGAASQS